MPDLAPAQVTSQWLCSFDGTFGIQTDLTHILLPAWLIRLEPEKSC